MIQESGWEQGVPNGEVRHPSDGRPALTDADEERVQEYLHRTGRMPCRVDVFQEYLRLVQQEQPETSPLLLADKQLALAVREAIKQGEKWFCTDCYLSERDCICNAYERKKHVL